MGRYTSEPTGGSGDFADVEPGNYAGRCFRIVDLGTTHEEYEGEVKTRNQVMISFELPDEKMNDGRPFSVSLWVTNSLHERATLRAVLETWRKRSFTPEELKRFDLATIMGVPGLVTVGKTKNGRAKALGVGPLPKGMVCPAAINPPQAFWLDEYSDAAFNALPEGIRGIVQRSDEYKVIKGVPTGGRSEDQPLPPSGRPQPDFDPDIPF